MSKLRWNTSPVWTEPEKLASVLLRLKDCLGASNLDGLGVTMTAELSDAYATKREGVSRILACVKRLFPIAIYVLNTDAKLESTRLGGSAPVWGCCG